MEINVRNKSKWNQQGVYIGRPSELGNPFKITEDQTREICIQRYGYMLISAIKKRSHVIMAELQKIEALLLNHPKHKVNLICHCAPLPCHGDLIKQVLLNKYHTNYWLINEKCSECGNKSYKIGVYGI